ncbi:MAG TPA: short-chain dehydrogenase [Firmicutes bacterium]|nr:short-chain dehydrogenase [Bacillota bacterium]
MNNMFKEKVAVVTGGASGIGLATTKKLLSEGANVVILDLKMDEEIINSLGENVLYLKCDVSNEENVKNCIEEIIKKFDHIDYLVANAGIGGSASKPHEVSMDEWNKVISVNQTGIFLLNKYVINEMLKSGKGAVVNTSSMYGLVGSTTSFAYSASKGAINQMTRSLALTYARDNIRVNAIAPGYVDTPILSMVPDNIKEAMGNELPIGRLGKDTEIANLICYLLSDDASFITGAIIPIDGGFTAK